MAKNVHIDNNYIQKLSTIYFGQLLRLLLRVLKRICHISIGCFGNFSTSDSAVRGRSCSILLGVTRHVWSAYLILFPSISVKFQVLVNTDLACSGVDPEEIISWEVAIHFIHDHSLKNKHISIILSVFYDYHYQQIVTSNSMYQNESL